MDANNITAQIISLNQPTAQAFVNLDECVKFCHQANEFIYQEYCAKSPKRFFAFATLPTQDGKAAAAELERCVKKYGFVGAMINGYTVTDDPTVGLYLDEKRYDALWAVSERLKKPIFVHPRVPRLSNLKVLEDMPVFHGAPYGFARETVEHLLRIMYSGVFDRFPNLKICLGHCGEGLSWTLPRTDTTFRMYSKDMLTSLLPMCITQLTKSPYRGARTETKVLPLLFSEQYYLQHKWYASNFGADELTPGNEGWECDIFS